MDVKQLLVQLDIGLILHTLHVLLLAIQVMPQLIKELQTLLQLPYHVLIVMMLIHMVM